MLAAVQGLLQYAMGEAFKMVSRWVLTDNIYIYTVACIIVRRLLISLHKWQFPGMADTHEYWSQHDAHLVHLPIFHGLNLIIFS